MTNVSILSTLHLHKKYESSELPLYCQSHQIVLKLVRGPLELNSLLAFTFLFCIVTFKQEHYTWAHAFYVLHGE